MADESNVETLLPLPEPFPRLSVMNPENGNLINSLDVDEIEDLDSTKIQSEILELEIHGRDMRTNDDTSDESGGRTPDTSEGDVMEEHSSGHIDVEEMHTNANDMKTNSLIRQHMINKRYFQTLLKNIREQLEIFYVSKSEQGILSCVVESLAAFETTFQLPRAPTTDSIWNVSHHEHRLVDYQTASEVGIVYKLKCDCNPGVPHINDVHCPRNIIHGPIDDVDNKKPSEESNEESDEEETAEQIAEREAKERMDAEEALLAKVMETRRDIDELVGMPELKSHIEKLVNRVESAKLQGTSILDERFGTMFIGGSGTGKTTAAKLYTTLLHSLGVVTSSTVKETTAIFLSDGGVDRTQRYIRDVEHCGGVFFIDGAHNFTNNNHSRGRKVLDFVIEEIERTKGKVVFLFAGHEKGMREILGSGGGVDVAGLFPNIIKFGDMDDQELRKVLWGCLKKKGGDRLAVEEGEEGLYMRIAARRIGRRRGNSAFGNARAVENVAAKIWERQGVRLANLRRMRKEKKELEERKLEEEKRLVAAEMVMKELEKKQESNTEKEDKDVKLRAAQSDLATSDLIWARMNDTLNAVVLDSAQDATQLENDSSPKEIMGTEINTIPNRPDDNQLINPKGLDTNSSEEKGSGSEKPSAIGPGQSTKPEEPSLKPEVHLPKDKDLSANEVNGRRRRSTDLDVNSNAPVSTTDSGIVQKSAEDSVIEPEDDYLLTKDDILGPDPTRSLILQSPAWKQLESLTGLSSVKESIQSLLSLVQTNYNRELQEKPPLQISLNRLFLGPPGTGKTLVAKLYAQLLTEIGALSKGEVMIRTPSDLIGKYRGHSEANTKAILTAAMGNVLVIDEAYMIYSSAGDGVGSGTDSFRKAIMDTLVGEIQSEPGEDRCVLLLGYEGPMQEMLQNGNPGLARRFPLSDAFWFQNFTAEELESLLRSKLKEGVLDATEEAITTAMGVLEKARSKVNFGNGGDVENLISKAKMNYQKRILTMPLASRPEQWTFSPQDFDPAFNRAKSASDNLHDLFQDVVGCVDIIARLDRYQRVCSTLKTRGLEPRDFIPLNFVFKGPPGTGKTTTARKMAQVYYDMGLLADACVVECSASDLVGKYVGHSGPKTRKVFERALGKVLFIDEAYRLAGGNSCSSSGSFNAEVVAEIVDLLTKTEFSGKLIVVLAGYEKEMNQLLSMNPGLASRFPAEFNFAALEPAQCLEILRMKLAKVGIKVGVLEDEKRGGQGYANLVELLKFLAKTPGWGSARDMETLAKRLSVDCFAAWDGTSDDLVCTGEEIAAAMDFMLQERRARRAAAR